MARSDTGMATRDMVLAAVTGGYKTSVQFFVAPADSGETCPITSEPLGAPALEGHEADRLFAEQPELNAVRLECGHCYNGMALMFYWTGTHMRCPMCRRGVDHVLRPGSFTGAWAVKWERDALRRRKTESLDGMREEESAMQAFVQESYVVSSLQQEVVIDIQYWEDLLSILPEVNIPRVVHEVSTVVYFYEMEGDDLRARHSESMLMHTDGSRFVTNPAGMRHLGRAVMAFRPTHLRLASFAVQLGGAILVFSHSPLIAMQDVLLGNSLETRDPSSGAVYTLYGMPGELPGVGSITLAPPSDMNLLLV